MIFFENPKTGKRASPNLKGAISKFLLLSSDNDYDEEFPTNKDLANIMPVPEFSDDEGIRNAYRAGAAHKGTGKQQQRHVQSFGAFWCDQEGEVWTLVKWEEKEELEIELLSIADDGC